MTTLRIPAEATGYTKQWLTYIDSHIAMRADLNRTTKQAEATALINHADGETHYFATLYARLLTRGGTP